MSWNVYQAAEAVKEHVIANTAVTTVLTSGVYGFYKGQIIKFRSAEEAIRLDGGDGFLFQTKYRNGNVEVTPFS